MATPPPRIGKFAAGQITPVRPAPTTPKTVKRTPRKQAKTLPTPLPAPGLINR